MARVIEAAARTRTALEINAYYERLDLNDADAKRAAESGVKIAISTDSHHPDQLWMMDLGVRTARRGWLTRSDVLNTLTVSSLRKALRHN
jgi:DNA polymerase (family 10)